MNKTGTLLLLALVVGCDADGLKVRNNEPEATILAPVGDDMLVDGYGATLLGAVTDTNDPASRLVATWLSGQDELCPEAPVASDGSTRCDITVDLADEAYTLLVRDPGGATGTATLEVSPRENGVPTVTVAAPDGPGPYSADTYVVVEALVSDAEDSPADLALGWTDEAGEPLALDTVVDSDGALSGAVLLPYGTHTLTLTVTDRVGAVGTGHVMVTVAE